MSDHSTTIVKEFTIPEATVSRRSDGIIHVHFQRNTVLDIELQSKLRELYEQATGGRASKFLFSSEEGFLLTREARENHRKNADPNISAYALVANNLAYRIIANFVLRVNKPREPYRLFALKEDAIAWLKSL